MVDIQDHLVTGVCMTVEAIMRPISILGFVLVVHNEGSYQTKARL